MSSGDEVEFLKSCFFPDDRAIFLIERDQGAPRASDHHYYAVLVGYGAARVAVDSEGAVELFYQVARPMELTRLLIQDNEACS